MSDQMKPLLVFLCVMCWVSVAAAQDLVITNARVLDGKGGVIERGSVVVRDGKIVSVAPGPATLPGARVIDVKGLTVMPGFIDSHRHPIGQGAEWLKSEAPARMQEFLDAGFTTVLSAGDDPAVAVPLRDQIAKGAIKGPRLIVLGRAPTAGAAAPPPAPAPGARGAAPPPRDAVAPLEAGVTRRATWHCARRHRRLRRPCRRIRRARRSPRWPRPASTASRRSFRSRPADLRRRR